MTFVVLSTPRSGTLSIASWLNRAPTWVVKHEPYGGSGRFADRVGRFGPSYGEVNSTLLADAPACVAIVDRAALVMRRPSEVMRSWYAWRHDLFDGMLAEHMGTICDGYLSWWTDQMAEAIDAVRSINGIVVRLDDLNEREHAIRFRDALGMTSTDVRADLGIHHRSQRRDTVVPEAFERVADALADWERYAWSLPASILDDDSSTLAARLRHCSTAATPRSASTAPSAPASRA